MTRAADDLGVDLDGDARAVDLQLLEQLDEAQALGDFSFFSIHLHSHRVGERIVQPDSMRFILHLVLAAAIVTVPLPSFGAGKYDAASSSARKKKKKKKVKKARAAEQEQADEAARAQGEDDESQGSRRKKKRRAKVIEVAPDGTATTTEGGDDETPTDKPTKTEPSEGVATPTPTPAAAEEEDDEEFSESPSKWIEALNRNVPPRRYAYVLGAVIGGTGLVFAYQAQGEAKRAETITSALEAQRAVNNARASAALANVMYGLAAAAIVIALVLEFLPEPIAEKAALTFHF